MFFDKIHLVSYLIFMYSLLVVDCQSEQFSSEMCLEEALTIHAFLRQKICPFKYLETEREPTRCLVLCKGIYTTKEVDPGRQCVAYDISFKLDMSLTTKLRDFNCEIPRCLLEIVDFVCTFNGQYADIPLNKTSSNENQGNGSCLDPGTSVMISLSCLVGGILIGISILVLVKRLRTYKQKLQPPPVFYQPNYGDDGDLLEERTATIGSPLETEYADIEETIRMVAKAIQVPSYKEDSSSETSSSLSSKSNDNSKVSTTGSAGSDKYYALEDEYLIANSGNGNK